MITLSERIKLELRHRDPIEIKELILDNSKATNIEGLSNEYRNLRQLSLVNVGLVSLKNFPSLPSLEKLDLSDNRISCGLENLKSCPKLNQLFLTNNKLRSLNELKALSHLQYLETLDLSNCQLSESENYRRKVFEMIPNLKHLDGYLEFEEVGEYESDYEYYEDDCYANFYDSDEQEEDESHDHNSAKNKHTAGKRGKFKSKVNDLHPEDDYEAQLGHTEFYFDDYQKNHAESDLFETTNISYLDDYTANDGVYADETEEEDDDDYQNDDEDEYTPPSHGSKFVPKNAKEQHHRALKRSYCYSDDYEASTKVCCQDNDSFSPVGAGLD